MRATIRIRPRRVPGNSQGFIGRRGEVFGRLHVGNGIAAEVIGGADNVASPNTPSGQHFTFASTNSRWGEFFVGGAPGVPLAQTNNYPGMAVPKDGYCVVSDEPGFGHGLSLEAIDAMSV